MNRVCLAMNLPTAAVSQYLDYDFNSMCTFNGVPLAGGDGGIFELDTIGSSNGRPIQAWFKLVTSDLGIENLKRARKITIGYESSGDLILTVYADETRTRDYPLKPILSGQAQQGNILYGARDIYGRYWSFLVKNVGGADFAVDSISIAPIILNRKK